jgi:signal transduction histidine kinase
MSDGMAQAVPPQRLPGSRTSCALLTVLTILLAWPASPAPYGAVVRTLYFALLAWFFGRAARASPALRGTALLLVRNGFRVLLACHAVSVGIHVAGAEDQHPFWTYLRQACEHGALFLLGTTLVAYGVMLLIPQVIDHHRLQEEDAARQRGALQIAETARTRLEQHLVDADRRAMLGELAASVAHDLRNPLTIVKGAAESLCRRTRDGFEVRNHTEVIQRNIDKANNVLEALIGLARPRTHEPQPIAPLLLLREVADLLQVESRRRQVTIRFAAAAEQMACTSDHALLVQALLNLALNALQASPAGSDVRLLARAFALSGRPRLALVAADRGPGIPPTVRERLGTPFFTTKADGTGLGLASCRRIATELRGGLRLYPRRAGGCRAILLLPAHADAPPVASRPPRTRDLPCTAIVC